MISRRKARIKALQALYMEQIYNKGHIVENPTKLKDFYNESLQQTIDAVYATLWMMKRINEYAQEDFDQQAKKFSDNQSIDKNILKLTQLDFIQKLDADPTFQKKKANLLLTSDTSNTLIRNLYKEYIVSDMATEFIQGGKDAPSEAELLSFLLADIMLPSDSFQDYMEERFSLWYDDETEVANIILRILQDNNEDINFNINIGPSVNNLGLTLIDSVISKKEYYDELIEPKFKNWDPKRIAPMSIITLYMGISEFLFLPTIPTVVTINEYIDITKQYGAESNKQFVNAVLDKVKVQLEEENLLNKEPQKKKD